MIDGVDRSKRIGDRRSRENGRRSDTFQAPASRTGDKPYVRFGVCMEI